MAIVGLASKYLGQHEGITASDWGTRQVSNASFGAPTPSGLLTPLTSIQAALPFRLDCRSFITPSGSDPIIMR
jgi:hypothetical protein